MKNFKKSTIETSIDGTRTWTVTETVSEDQKREGLYKYTISYSNHFRGRSIYGKCSQACILRLASKMIEI